MRRHMMILSLAGVFGLVLSAGDASACCKKKCTPACAPAPVVACAPAPAPVVTCAPAPVACAPAKKCGGMKFKMPKMGGLCHKKAAPACAAAPVAYYAPAASYASPQASAQSYASGQGM